MPPIVRHYGASWRAVSRRTCPYSVSRRDKSGGGPACPPRSAAAVRADLRNRRRQAQVPAELVDLPHVARDEGGALPSEGNISAPAAGAPRGAACPPDAMCHSQSPSFPSLGTARITPPAAGDDPARVRGRGSNGSGRLARALDTMARRWIRADDRPRRRAGGITTGRAKGNAGWSSCGGDTAGIDSACAQGRIGIVLHKGIVLT